MHLIGPYWSTSANFHYMVRNYNNPKKGYLNKLIEIGKRAYFNKETVPFSCFGSPLKFFNSIFQTYTSS